MLLDKSTFVDVRKDTYALFVHDLSLYYYYAKALLAEFIQEAKREMNAVAVGHIGFVMCHMTSLIRSLLEGKQFLSGGGGVAD